MALQALWAPETQFQNKNGSLLVNGKIYVQYRGRSQLAKTYRDAAGVYQNTNPLLTDNDGRVLCFADDAFSYTAVVCDFYGNELFSFDPIPSGSAGGGSASSGMAEHWLGWNGASSAVPSNAETRLRIPAGMDNVDYDGGFLKRIESSGTEMVLEEGLYLVNAVIRFQQDPSDLSNDLSNVFIHTREFSSANMQEVGATLRDEAGPDSSSEDVHTISMTFIRHAYEDDVGSDRLKFAVDTPNSWSSCYIQNLQIAKLGSSVNGGGTVDSYDAGQYISIENNTISVTGIDPDSYVTSGDLSDYVKQEDLASYATEQWVLDKNYITSADIPDIPDDVVTSAELAHTSGAIEQDISDLTSAMTDALADKMDKSSSADFYPMATNPSGYLTSVPSEYVTDTEMSEYVTEQTSSFITSSDITEYSAGQYIDITDNTISVSPVKSLVPGDNISITASGDSYVLSAQVPETSAFVTEQEMNDAIDSATSAFITSADIPPLPEDLVTSGELATVSGEIVNQIPSLYGYATEEYVTEHTSAFLTSADLPDVSDMATKTWVGQQGYLTSIPSEYVTSAELETELAGKADTSAIPDVSHFVTQEDIDAAVSGKMDSSEASAFYPMATNPSGYLVSSDLNGYASEQYVQDYTSGFVDSTYVSEYVASQTSGKQDALTFSYNEADKISAINGSALAGEDGATYSAGDNIDITDDVISITDTSNLIAGDNISITASGDDYVISSVGGSTYSAGQYVSISGDVISVTGVQPAGNYATQEDLASYATQSYVDSSVSGKMDASEASAFYPMDTNPSGYLVSSDLNGYATESYVTSQTSGKQDTLTFGYDESDKINAINGSAIAGGGGGGSYTAGEFIDITNDVISVNSGDVSNLIPGNGILITQSSAGIVVSIDTDEMPGSTPYETTLWEGENGELISADNYSVNLSDDPLSYSRIGVYGRPNENAGCQNYVEFDPSYSAVCKTVTPYYNSTTLVLDVNTYSFSGNNMTLVSQTHIAGTTSYAGGLWIYKVVGINKKET